MNQERIAKPPEVEIKLGLPAAYTEQAVDLFATAFESKFAVLLGDRDRIKRMLGANLNPEHALCALDRDGHTLLGLLGLHIKDQPFFSDIRLETFIKEHGLIMGNLRGLIAGLLFARQPGSTSELLMDGIAVNPEARGLGIGTQLMRYMFKFARQQNYKTIRLDVIDENPHAHRLYKRLGFQSHKHEDVSYLKWLIGTSGVTTMIYDLASKERVST